MKSQKQKRQDQLSLYESIFEYLKEELGRTPTMEEVHFEYSNRYETTRKQPAYN